MTHVIKFMKGTTRWTHRGESQTWQRYNEGFLDEEISKVRPEESVGRYFQEK